MRFLSLSLVLTLFSLLSYGQRAQRFNLGIQADLIKSDNDGFFEKIQGGIEANYHFSRKFSATAGVEWWTGDQVSAAVGIRFSPIDEAFIRLRSLPGNDFSLGAGFAKPLSEDLRFEAIADLFLEGHIAIRAGIAWTFGGSP
jgi:hypothetical protein